MVKETCIKFTLLFRLSNGHRIFIFDWDLCAFYVKVFLVVSV